MKRGSVCPILTPTQARFLQGAARRAKDECSVGDERRTWAGAYRALSAAIQQMRSGAKWQCDCEPDFRCAVHSLAAPAASEEKSNG